jgi:hypothetical protein
VTQRRQPSILAMGGETSETSPSHILEQDALDRIFGAEREDLFEARDGEHTSILLHRQAPRRRTERSALAASTHDEVDRRAGREHPTGTPALRCDDALLPA